MEKRYNNKIFFLAALALFTCCVTEEINDMQETTTTGSASTATATTAPTTTETAPTTTETAPTTTETAPTTTTEESIKKTINSCRDYCLRNRYVDGICRLNGFECRRIGGRNERYEPFGDRYCPRGQPNDACCCLLREGTERR